MPDRLSAQRQFRGDPVRSATLVACSGWAGNTVRRPPLSCRRVTRSRVMRSIARYAKRTPGASRRRKASGPGGIPPPPRD